MNSKIMLYLIAAVVVVAIAFVPPVVVGYTLRAMISADAAGSNNPVEQHIVKIQAGGGDATAPLNTFSPQQVEINTGDTVSWYNPTQVAEPHTVTFVLDNKTMAGFAVPFGVSSSTQFMSLPPGYNSEPAIIPGKNGMNTVVAINARVYNPVVIDSLGNVKKFAVPNATYTLNGNEKYVNSGFILPKGQEKGYPGSSNTFTVTFQKPGTYEYLCIIHPWMTGKVVVVQ
jgi:plastocyanin